MERNIIYDSEIPTPAQVYRFYEAMGWEPFLGKTEGQLHSAMRGSWSLCCAWDGGELVGMGRVVSDGFLNAYICGVGVLPGYRGRGIGGEIMQKLISRCAEHGMKPQLMCEEHLVPHYRKMGFEVFAAGMKMR